MIFFKLKFQKVSFIIMAFKNLDKYKNQVIQNVSNSIPPPSEEKNNPIPQKTDRPLLSRRVSVMNKTGVTIKEKMLFVDPFAEPDAEKNIIFTKVNNVEQLKCASLTKLIERVTYADISSIFIDIFSLFSIIFFVE